MTNRQWLAGLSDEALADLLLAKATPRGCPPGVVEPDALKYDYDPCPTMDGCCACWLDWLRAESDKPITAIYDIVEEHKNCTVQVLKNSVTGEISVGWKEVKEMKRNEGEWLKNVCGDHCIVCSECGYGLPTEGFAWTDCNRESDERETAVLITDVKSYCPSCGAKMRNA